MVAVSMDGPGYVRNTLQVHKIGIANGKGFKDSSKLSQVSYAAQTCLWLFLYVRSFTSGVNQAGSYHAVQAGPETHYVAQAGLQLPTILLPQSSHF